MCVIYNIWSGEESEHEVVLGFGAVGDMASDPVDVFEAGEMLADDIPESPGEETYCVGRVEIVGPDWLSDIVKVEALLEPLADCREFTESKVIRQRIFVSDGFFKIQNIYFFRRECRDRGIDIFNIEEMISHFHCLNISGLRETGSLLRETMEVVDQGEQVAEGRYVCDEAVGRVADKVITSDSFI